MSPGQWLSPRVLLDSKTERFAIPSRFDEDAAARQWEFHGVLHSQWPIRLEWNGESSKA
jgi:hypothetical protein